MKAISDITTVDLAGLLTDDNLIYLHQLEDEIKDKQKKIKEDEKKAYARQTEDMVEGNKIDIASNLAADDDLICDEEVIISHKGFSIGKSIGSGTDLTRNTSDERVLRKDILHGEATKGISNSDLEFYTV